MLSVSVSTSLFSNYNNFDNDVDLETSGINTLFNGKSYPFELSDVYDDANSTKIYTNAYLQTEIYNNTISDWNGTVVEDEVLVVNNTNYKSPSNTDVSMIDGTFDDTDNMRVNDDSNTEFTSAGGGETTIYLDPDGDAGTNQWSFLPGPNHFNGIDDGVREPTVPTYSGDYISAIDGDENQIEDFTMETDTVGVVTQITLWHYGMATTGEDCFNDILVGGGWQGYLLCGFTTSKAWKSRTIVGTWDQADIDAIQIRYKADSVLGTYEKSDVYALYLEVTFSDPTYLNFTIDLNFNEVDTSKLLALDVFSYHYTNISTTIVGNVYDYNSGTYVEMFSSDNVAETENYFVDDTSVSNYLDSSGNLRIQFKGTNAGADFKLSIDYIMVRFYYKMNLIIYKSFSINGVWRYRFKLIGSLHYTDWTVFEVINPSPNFYAISESDLTTRWILQGAEISPVEDFHDDINTDYWDLVDVLEHIFQTFNFESYLLDNISVLDKFQYSGVYFYVGTEDPYVFGITWDGTYFWALGYINTEVYKYTSAGVYTGTHFNVGAQDTLPTDITWDGTDFWVVGRSTDEVYKYNSAGVYQDVHFDVGSEETNPSGITWDGTDFWVVGMDTDEVYKYNSAGVYQDVHFDVGSEDIVPSGITWDGTDFWVVGMDTDEVYKYNSAGVYQDVHFDVGAQDGETSGIIWDGTYLGVVGVITDKVYRYEPKYDISKNYFGEEYTYMQTNTTELISLKSVDYTTHYNLSSGDYFEVDFQTSSDSKINLILLKDGGVNKTLTLSQSGNTNFGRHTAKISVSDFVEFDQLKISSMFEDEDHVKIYDIKTKKYTFTGDHADFFVGSNRDYEVYLTPDVYNLRIFDPYDGDVVINENITIPATGVKQYLYVPIGKIQCRLALFNIGKENYLNFIDYHIDINRSLNGVYNDFPLLDDLFYADEETYVYINVSDKFDTLIDTFEILSSSYIDLELAVYQLQIKNLMEQKTTLDINGSYTYPLLSGDSIYFTLSTSYYQIGYYDTNSVYKQFTIYLSSNQAYELNKSQPCFLIYADQQGNPMGFENYKTYLNGSRIYTSLFYREIRDIVGIEIKDRYDISVKNDTLTVVSGVNEKYVVLTMHSLKVMNQQEIFNHINITRDPAHYESEMYWSEWIAPTEIIEFKLFAGYYKINLTDNENSGYSYYSYMLNGDDILLISSGNVISNVIVNIANVNATLGNQITNVEINITNQNTAINNSIISIVINLDNINSSLGTILLDIDTAITNINTSIIDQIVLLGTDISNINTSIINQILDIGVDITNVNSSIIAQLLTLGVDITNINGSIIDQIILLGVDVTNINTSLSNQILAIEVDISNLDTSITNQITNVISNITNVNTTLSTQITSLSSDIVNVNSSIVNQIVSLGVDITNVNTSISNQILSLNVDLTNINASIAEQILSVIADISNLDTVIDDQTLVILSDISNVNSTILNQMVALGVDITNVNASITNQILSLSVDLTNINSSITNLLNNIVIDITNIDNDIGAFYAFTNTSFINLNNVINTSFIYLENNIISFNQSISNLVIGVSNNIYLINGTITTMISSLENNLLLMNVSINTALINLDTVLNLIGSNITSNYILLNNSINLTNLNINDSRIAMINNLLIINSTISNLISEVYSSVYLINNSIYMAVVDLGTYLGVINNTISGNLSIVLEQNEFLTEIYRMTMFSELLNWTNIGLNTSLLTSQIDVWEFVNHYKNQSVEIHLRYQGLIDNLTVSAQNTMEQYLPGSGVEYREWSVTLQEYVGKWKPLPEDKIVDFGFYETEVPSDPEPITNTFITYLIVVIFLAGLAFGALKLYYSSKERKNEVPPELVNLTSKPHKKKIKGVVDNRL